MDFFTDNFAHLNLILLIFYVISFDILHIVN
jgi:hypothetical protein